MLIDSIFEGKKNGRLFIDPGCIESTKERRSSRLSIYRPDAEHTHKRENRKKKRAPTPSKRSVTAGVNKPPCAETGSTQPGAANRFKNFFFFPAWLKMNCVFITKERKLFSSSSPVLKIRPTSANSSKTNTNKRGGGRLKGVSVARLKTLRIWYSAVQVLHRHFFTSFGRTGNQVKINLPPAEKETFGDKKKFGGS